MRIEHYTDLESATNIVNTKVFKAYSSCIYCGDSGLNSFLFGSKNFYRGQNFNKKGVSLILDWTGNIEYVSINMPTQNMDRNTMYIQEEWRCFIPVNADHKLLKAVRIDYDEDILNNLIKYPFYYYLIPNYFVNLKNKIKIKCEREVDYKINGLIYDNDIYISVK